MTDLPPIDPPADPRIQELARRLAAREPRVSAAYPPLSARDAALPMPRASVALVVRPQPTDLQLLLIRRARFEGDPWSGHVALPGGRRDAEDRDGLHTAIRETAEEVGIDLAADGLLLGALEEVKPTGAAPPIHVAPYVFAVPAATEPTPNHEVDTAFWIPLRHLADPASAVEHLHTLETGENLTFPAIGYEEFVVWGLTYRILAEFAEVVRSEDGDS